MVPAPRAPKLLVADSFRARVRDGVVEVRALTAHLERFSTAVTGTLASTTGATHSDDTLPRFLNDARTRIAAAGSGFPRLELIATPHGSDASPVLQLSLRPLPPLGSTIRLRVAGAVELPCPSIKGPNIARLGALNHSLSAEAVLLDVSGRVLEGATTSLVIWRDGRLLRVASPQRVTSVTEQLVSRIAADAGVCVHDAELEASDLVPGPRGETEVWAVNALHGIRPAQVIDDVGFLPPDAERLRAFRAALDRTWEPVLP